MTALSKWFAASLAALPLVVAAQSNPIPNDPSTTGRQNTVTGTDATDTTKNIAKSSNRRGKAVKKPAGQFPGDPSSRPNEKSRQDFPKSSS